MQQLPASDSPLTPDQQCTLQAMVRALVERGGHYAAIWSRFNNHFRLGSYKQLPQSRMSEAVDYLMRFEVAPKALPASDSFVLPEPKLTPAQEELMPVNLPDFIKEVERGVKNLNSLTMRMHLFGMPSGFKMSVLSRNRALVDAICANMSAAHAANVASLGMLKSVLKICSGIL